MKKQERDEVAAVAEQANAGEYAPRAGIVSQATAATAAVNGLMNDEDDHASVEPDRPRVGARYIWFLLLAVFGVNVALVAPIGLSLSLRVQELAPNNVEYLGVVLSVTSIVGLFTPSLFGMWSDRTRSRWGRRRPFALVGGLAGFSGLLVMAAAPNLVLLTVGWIVASIGFSTTINSVLMSQADRLPEAQRGKVAGLSGFITMLSSVVGVGLAAPFAGNNFLLFLVPGGVGLLLVLLWVFFVPEASSLDAEVRAKLGLRGTLKGLVFNPKQHPDFAWNWLGRVLFQTGVSFATAFTTLFFASRLSPTGQVADITGFITMLALIGVIASAGGAFASGFLSDKFQRRRIFVLIAGIMFTAGALTMAFGGSNPVLLVIGSVVTSTGLGIFATVDQAIILDILPVEDAGRFIGINGYSTALAQAIAPALAVPLLLIGVTGTDKNYGLLLVVAGVISMIGGLIVVLKVRKAK